MDGRLVSGPTDILEKEALVSGFHFFTHVEQVRSLDEPRAAGEEMSRVCPGR